MHGPYAEQSSTLQPQDGGFQRELLLFAASHVAQGDELPLRLPLADYGNEWYQEGVRVVELLAQVSLVQIGLGRDAGCAEA